MEPRREILGVPERAHLPIEREQGVFDRGVGGVAVGGQVGQAALGDGHRVVEVERHRILGALRHREPGLGRRLGGAPVRRAIGPLEPQPPGPLRRIHPHEHGVGQAVGMGQARRQEGRAGHEDKQDEEAEESGHRGEVRPPPSPRPTRPTTARVIIYYLRSPDRFILGENMEYGV